MRGFLIYLFLVWSLHATAPCFLKGIIQDSLTEKTVKNARIYNHSLRSNAVQDNSFILPIRLNMDNLLLLAAEEYLPKEIKIYLQLCPTDVQIFSIQPKVKEIEAIEIDGYNAKTMLYQMIHTDPLQNKAIAEYVDVKKYDPTQLPEGTLAQISSPISSLFALGNKQSRQKRKINQFRTQLKKEKTKDADSLILFKPLKNLDIDSLSLEEKK